jgi:integrase
MFQGNLIAVSSKCKGKDGKELAKRMEADHRLKLGEGRGGLKPIAKPITFGVAAKDFLLEKKPHWAKKTREIHDNSMKHHLGEFFNDVLLTDISSQLISKYQSRRQSEGASNRSINIEVSLVRMVMRKAKKWVDIEDEVKMLQEEESPGRELSDSEMNALLTACKASNSRGLYTAVLVSIHSAVRNAELRNLRWRQVDLDEGTITVGKSKTVGGTGRIVPLSQGAWNALTEWKAQFPDAQPDHAVFPREKYGLIGTTGVYGGSVKPFKTFPEQPVRSFATAWRRAKKNADTALRIAKKRSVEQWKKAKENTHIEKFRWHDLRHSAVSRLAASGVNDGTIQEIAGWMSPKMIKKYSHVRAAAMRQAVSVFDKVVTNASVV